MWWLIDWNLYLKHNPTQTDWEYILLTRKSPILLSGLECAMSCWMKVHSCRRSKVRVDLHGILSDHIHDAHHLWHHPTQIGWLLSQATSTIADTVPPRLDGCSARPPVTLLTLSHPDRMAAEPHHQYHCWHHPTQIRWLLSQATSTIADTVPPGADGPRARPAVPLLTLSFPDWRAAQPGHQCHCWHHPTQISRLFNQATSIIADTVPLSQATSTIADTIPPRSDGCWARPPLPLLTQSHPDWMAVHTLVPFLTLSH